ncbi:glycosyltransferase family 2 protein [Ferruginibacter profundus]
MNTPVLFSIIIPTYNRASFILKTVNAFIAQSYSNFEVIIVDDGSKDNTDEVVKEITDKRISYYKKVNAERGAARNYGLDIAKGDYVNFFDSDDLAYPNHLETAFKVITQFNNPDIFNLGYDIKTPEGKLLSECRNFDGNVEAYAIKTKRVSINALFVKRTVALEIRFSENRLLSASEDALFLCQLCARYTLQYNNTITSTIVEHDSRSMVVASEQQLLNRQKYLDEGLKADAVFMNKYGQYVDQIKGEMDYLLCLSCLSNKDNGKAWTYYKNFLAKSGMPVLSKRTLVVLKKIVQNKLGK